MRPFFYSFWKQKPHIVTVVFPGKFSHENGIQKFILSQKLFIIEYQNSKCVLTFAKLILAIIPNSFQNMSAIKTISDPFESYFKQFPESTIRLLESMRKTIRAAAPLAEEAISYQMPTYKLNGNLVHFAAYKNHIGFYPTPSAMKKFAKELAVYTTSKGAVQFPISEPLPLKLITTMVQFRVMENSARAKPQKSTKCVNGHTFTKTSDCPTCPICEKEKKNKHPYFSFLGAPAIRALENAGIKNLKQLSKKKEKELLMLHGLGKAGLASIKIELRKNGLSLASE